MRKEDKRRLPCGVCIYLFVRHEESLGPNLSVGLHVNASDINRFFVKPNVCRQRRRLIAIMDSKVAFS